MSEHSSSPRLEALESSVSEIQEKMSELVGMLRQLTTETRTAGDGRRGEESGGARRDAAHIYNSGARRGPLTAATGYRVTAVQDEGTGEATAARNFPVHHRAASEPADTRPGLPTGVGPMIDVRRGEARDPYLAGITAYDESRDVLRTDFKSLPARVVPPVLKAEKGGFQKFKHEFFLKANMLDITAHFVDQGMRAVPVGDPLKQKAVLLQEGFSNDEIRTAYQAWNFIDAALQSESDRSILKRCKSPREVFERLEKWHDPDSEVATQRLYDKFHEFTIPPHSDPIAALHDLEDTNNQMHEKGIGRIPDAVVHARFVRALPRLLILPLAPPPGGEAPAAESGAGAAGVRKATPQHHRPPPGGEAPAAELGAGAAGARKATPRHHRPPSGGEAPAAEFAAAATGVRTATPRHQRFPPGGEAPAAEFAAAATGVRTATPRHQRFPPGGEAPAAKFAAAATGVRMATPRHQRFPPGGEAPAAKFAAAATGVRMATPRHQRFPPGGEAPAAKYVAAATGVRKVTPRHHRSPPGGPISVALTATVAATAAGQPYQQRQQQRQRRWRFSHPREETCAGPGGLRRAPRTTERPHEVSVAGLGHESVLRGRPVGVRHEGHGSREAHGGEGRGGRTSSRLPAGRATGEGT